MSDTDTQVPLPDLNNAAEAPANDIGYNEDEQAARIAADLEAVFDVPVQVSAVLGRSKMDVGELLKLGPGTVLELDRRVGRVEVGQRDLCVGVTHGLSLPHPQAAPASLRDAR